jgi:hypothetical protein
MATGKAYYVDPVSGNNGNTGLSWAQAFKDALTATAKADAVVIYLMPGQYCYEGTAMGTRGQFKGIGGSARSLICVGGQAILTVDLGLAYTLDTTHYEATTTRTINKVWDSKYTNANGSASQYTLVANEAAVEATPGSYYKGGSNDFYIRTIDDREPDNDIHVALASAPGGTITADNKTYYYENCTFAYGAGGITHQNSSATGGLIALFKNCNFYNLLDAGVTNLGVDLAVMQGCNFKWNGNGDFMEHNARNGIVTSAIEINCVFDYGDSGGSDNASTSHGCKTVRIMGECRNVGGPLIADVTSNYTWCLGTKVITSDTPGGGYGFYNGGLMWLDTCLSQGNSNYDLTCEAACTIYYHDLISGGVNTGAGTFTPY